MASAAEAIAQATASNELIDLATRDLQRLAPGVLVDGASTADVVDVYQQVIEAYSPMQATLAADFYDEQRIRSGARGRFTTQVAGHGFALEALERHAGRALDEALKVGIAEATALLTKDLERVVKQAGRNTGIYNATRERVSWARVPAGPNPCAFCLLLASRGPVYSKETVTAREDGQRYHYACNCQGHRIESKSDYPENFDPDEMYLVYREAYNEVLDRAKAQGNSGGIVPLESVVATMRRQHPELVRDGVFTS